MTDAACLFCRIVAGELPSTRVHEDELVVAFRDIAPRAPTHILVIPRAHPSAADLTEADAPLLGRLFAVAADLARAEGIADAGYRLVTNVGRWGGQTVDHLHFHLHGRPPVPLAARVRRAGPSVAGWRRRRLAGPRARRVLADRRRRRSTYPVGSVGAGPDRVAGRRADARSARRGARRPEPHPRDTVAYRPPESAPRVGARGRSTRSPCPADPDGGFIVIYEFADTGRRPRRRRTGRRTSRPVPARSSRRSGPSTSSARSGTTVVYYSWLPGSSKDPGAQAIQVALETLGQRVPRPGLSRPRSGYARLRPAGRDSTSTQARTSGALDLERVRAREVLARARAASRRSAGSGPGSRWRPSRRHRARAADRRRVGRAAGRRAGRGRSPRSGRASSRARRSRGGRRSGGRSRCPRDTR